MEIKQVLVAVRNQFQDAYDLVKDDLGDKLDAYSSLLRVWKDYQRDACAIEEGDMETDPVAAHVTDLVGEVSPSVE